MSKIFLRLRRKLAKCPKSRQLLTDKLNYLHWKSSGSPVPPPHDIKAAWLRCIGVRLELPTLVETGTYKGDMVAACSAFFQNIFSVELGVELAAKANERFAGDDHVQIIQGDSGKVLAGIVKQLEGPALFWLDGHYSMGDTAQGDKDCPIIEELQAIQNSNFAHVVLIDDLRCFTGESPYEDYPTVEMIKAAFLNRCPSAVFDQGTDHLYISMAGLPRPTLA